MFKDCSNPVFRKRCKRCPYWSDKYGCLSSPFCQYEKDYEDHRTTVDLYKNRSYPVTVEMIKLELEGV